jgi:hypothetical protein
MAESPVLHCQTVNDVLEAGMLVQRLQQSEQPIGKRQYEVCF